MPLLAALVAAFKIAFQHGGEGLAHEKAICTGVIMRVVFCSAICYSRGHLASLNLGNGGNRPGAAIGTNVIMCEFFLMTICYSLLLFITTSPKA